MANLVEIAGIYSRQDAAGLPLGPDDEYVVLVNMGEEAVDLRGWSVTTRLSDGSHHYRSHIPRFLSAGESWSLGPGGVLFLHTGRGPSRCAGGSTEAGQFHFYLHRRVHMWQHADAKACLFDPYGEVACEYEMPMVHR